MTSRKDACWRRRVLDIDVHCAADSAPAFRAKRSAKGDIPDVGNGGGVGSSYATYRNIGSERFHLVRAPSQLVASLRFASLRFASLLDTLYPLTPLWIVAGRRRMLGPVGREGVRALARRQCKESGGPQADERCIVSRRGRHHLLHN